jgi:hypothetical protein
MAELTKNQRAVVDFVAGRVQTTLRYELDIAFGSKRGWALVSILDSLVKRGELVLVNGTGEGRYQGYAVKA